MNLKYDKARLRKKYDALKFRQSILTRREGIVERKMWKKKRTAGYLWSLFKLFDEKLERARRRGKDYIVFDSIDAERHRNCLCGISKFAYKETDALEKEMKEAGESD